MNLEVRQAAISLLPSHGIAGRLVSILTRSAVFFGMTTAALGQQVEPLPLTRNLLGSAGLIDMPSARMADDGTLSAGASYMKNIQHYNLGFQALPWLEASFRYSGIAHFDPSSPVYWDRSFGMKVRLANESAWMPAVALGINDMIGTGIYSGEYLAATKQFGDFDATLGIGWGRYGSNNTIKNPLRLISSSFDKNRPGTSTPGGTPFGSFFRGPQAGVFGGINWRTPIEGLTLSVENSGDAYRFEAQQGAFFPHSSWNYGLSYHLGSTLISASYLYGNTFAGAISFELDPTRPQYPFTMGAAVPGPTIRTAEAQQDALRRLAGQHDPQYMADRAQAGSRNGFVDAVFGMPAVGDAIVNGDTLAVTMAGSANPQTLCRDIAHEAGFSETKIVRISIRSAMGAAAANCAVPRMLHANASPADFKISASQRINQLMLIDAADVQPAGDRRAAEKKFRADAQNQSIRIAAMQFAETEATIYYENYHYLHEDDAVERLSRLLMADAPLNIEQFRLVALKGGLPQQEFHILRGPAERVFGEDREVPSIFDSPVDIHPPPLQNPILKSAQRSQYPSFDWSIYPQLHEQLFDPNNPLGLQLVGVVAGGVQLKPGLQIIGGAELNIFSTFRTDRPSDSVLPHVRTDYVRYFVEGKNGIAWLQANYRTRLTPEIYASVKAGYLESMYAGAGGEVLYRPSGARWAIGADLYEVWQRDYDRLFGLRNYHIGTGHVTVYWDSPFYDLNFQLRTGQYLAGDRGLTLQVTRRFSTGIEIGAWMTKTNVSAAQFGEGSFDKGIMIRIPLGWVMPADSQNQVNFNISPVQRDGGQVLLGDATLYEETRATSESEFVRNGKFFANDN